MKRFTAALLLGASIQMSIPAGAQVNAGAQAPEASPPFTLNQIATFNLPWRIAFLPDSRMLVTAAVTKMRERFPNLDLILIESGGDNLAATFSPELADVIIYVIDVSGGEKIPRKGGPGITRSDFLVINKTDLTPMVGASLDVMDADARKMRGARPYGFTNMKTGAGVDVVANFIVEKGGLAVAR